jgi:hypothetical protein
MHDTGEALDWREDLRRRIVSVATSEVGPQQKGSPEVCEYWRRVLDPSMPDSVVKNFAKAASWCGGFYLWCLHEAGVTRDLYWKVGLGFVATAHLPRTDDPKPGDLAYFDQPFQHHAVVSSLIDGTLTTIDGNAPDVRIKSRPMPKNAVFYSIETLLKKAMENDG